MAVEDQVNLFGKLGIDTRTEEQILAEKQAKQVAAVLASAGKAKDAAHQDLRNSGAGIAALLAKKFNKPKISEQEQMMLDIRAKADKDMAIMVAGGAFDKPDGTVNALAMGEERQRLIAEGLIVAGDPRGVDLARQLDQLQRTRKTDAAELKKLGIDIETGELERDVAQFDFDRKQFLTRRGELTSVYPTGSADPNSSITAFIGDDGIARSLDDDDNLVELGVGQYSLVRPQAPDEGGRSGGGTDKFIPTPSEQGQIRAQQRALVQQMRLGVTMRDAMADAVNPDGSINIMDGAGSFIGGAAKMANNVNALYREGTKWLGLVDETGKPTSRIDGSSTSITKYLESNKDVSELIPVPEAISKDERAINRYKAAVVQMAYAKARANEPGARQLSDADFKNAIQQIGAAASDPEALRQVLFGDITRGVEDFQLWRSQIGQDNAGRIIQPGAMKMFDSAYEDFNDAFSVDFGSPTQAGPGILDVAPEDRASGSVGESNRAPSNITGSGTADDPIIIK